MRTSFYQARTSRIPQVAGLCEADAPSIASIVNEATQRLVQAGGESGWYGSWAKTVFNVVPCENPYITAGREVARLINIDVCRCPVRIQNEFYEFLEFGAGLQRQDPHCSSRQCGCEPIQMYDRGMFPTMRDITPGFKIRVYLTNGADTTKRIFFNAVDNNGNQIYTFDRGVSVDGFFLTMDNAAPFIESPMRLNSIAGVLKDVTVGPLKVYEVNPVTDEQTLIATYAPSEINPSYRRYFLHNLPSRCNDCDAPNDQVQVTALAKLEYIPVAVDTDFLLIGNIPALKEECQSIRYGEMDVANAKQMEEFHHRRAIRLLNQELIHYMGKERPAVGFHPFGGSSLESAGVGLII